MEEFPQTGKIQNNFFKQHVFPYCGTPRNEVIIGPQYGVDVSVVNLSNGMAMAMTSDPLSLIPTLGLRESAWLSVQLMANDMATTGFSPMYAQFVLNLPATLTANDFEVYWKYIHEFCDRLGVAITGGHTGRFDGLQSTIAGGGTMITIANSEDIITSKGATPGDILIMTKECALISTAILALSFPETIKKNCGEAIHKKGCNLFYETSAVEAGLVAGEFGRHTKSVTAMHDVTEGGVLGAVYELAVASQCGVIVYEDNIMIGEAQEKICNQFNIDPKWCIGAGAMIIAVKPDKSSMLLSLLKTKQIDGTVIGQIVDNSKGVIIQNGSEQKKLILCETDPYWEAFYTALKLGLK